MCINKVESNVYNYNYIIIILNYTTQNSIGVKIKKCGFFILILINVIYVDNLSIIYNVLVYVLIMQNDEKIVITIAIINFCTEEEFSSLRITSSRF